MATRNAPTFLKIFLINVALLASGCTSTALKMESTPVDIPVLTVPTPEPIMTMPVKWEVINHNGVEFFALTPSAYKNLSTNQAEILRYIQQQQSVISAYKEYYGKTTDNKSPK